MPWKRLRTATGRRSLHKINGVEMNRLKRIREMRTPCLKDHEKYIDSVIVADLDWLIAAVEAATDAVFGVCLLDLHPREQELMEKLKEKLGL